MATSRTGTTEWKRIRRQALRDAKDNGQRRCIFCPAELDYRNGRLPNSAEVDHIRPHSRGGTDALSNLQVCCRRCNQSKGDGTRPRKNAMPEQKPAAPLKTSRSW